MSMDPRERRGVRLHEGWGPVKWEKETVQNALAIQAAVYKHFRFPERLGMSNEEFDRLVAGLAVPQPEIYRGKFDIPVVVIGSQIPVAEQYRMIGVTSFLEDKPLCDLDPIFTPSSPTLIWMDEGRWSGGLPVNEALHALPPFGRGANIYDGVGLCVALPSRSFGKRGMGMIKGPTAKLPGTRVGRDCYPTLGLFGPMTLSYQIDGYRDPNSGTATCGR